MTLFLKPRRGLVVRDPDTAAVLPEGGARVPDSRYWRRRLASGDVERSRPAPKPRASKKPETGTTEAEPASATPNPRESSKPDTQPDSED